VPAQAGARRQAGMTEDDTNDRKTFKSLCHCEPSARRRGNLNFIFTIIYQRLIPALDSRFHGNDRKGRE